MAVEDIEYVELYTSNRQSAVEYFVSSLGFAQVAESVDSDTSSALLRQAGVQLMVTTGPGTHEFLDAHGDGVVDIALTCDDPAAARDAAVAAGAGLADSPAASPAVCGFGGVRHTLLPRAGRTGSSLPAGRSWIGVPGGPAGPSGRVRQLDHVAVCLAGGTLDDYADFYLAAFGLARYSSEYVDVGDQAMDSIVVRNPSGGVTFTLVAPDPLKSAGQLDAFLDRNGGEGVQHLAFLVDSIIPAVHECQGRGVEFLKTPGAYYDTLSDRFADMREEIADLRAANVLADRDEWGYLLQLFTRSPYERNTLFYEFIQRRGARGFGAANIRALYEAVERERLAAE
jgi:4-hydroxymandelate synthase